MTTVFIILGIFAGLMIVLQVFIAVGARRQRGRQIHGIGGPLGAAISSGDRVLAYFYTPSCSACRTQTPIIERLQGEYENIYKVDVAEHFEAARAFGVIATPTTVIVEEGKVVEVMVGSRNEAHLREALL
ncbi:MAG: thioredoxin 1 [Bacteroidetes bacterium]|nr:thioredoxin 1 [Bacteroidota bacterium]